jgi:hypothetical protein
MVIMEKGHFGQYTGNARHSRTPVTKRNYRASVADDAAHIHYLKEDINYDAKHGHSDENMTADEKHISKLAGDMKYDKKHHGSPAKQTDEREGSRGTSITEGIDLDETTASLSDMYRRDAKLTVPDFPNLREDTSGRMFVQGQPTGSNPYIGRGSFVEGSVGSVYTPEQISAGRKKYEDLAKRKKKAQDYLAANK